jgi:hypothetical protein
VVVEQLPDTVVCSRMVVAGNPDSGRFVARLLKSKTLRKPRTDVTILKIFSPKNMAFFLKLQLV